MVKNKHKCDTFLGRGDTHEKQHHAFTPRQQNASIWMILLLSSPYLWTLWTLHFMRACPFLSLFRWI